MNNRPALRLELSGRVDPATDLDGLKRVSIERKVKAQKLKGFVRQRPKLLNRLTKSTSKAASIRNI